MIGHDPPDLSLRDRMDRGQLGGWDPGEPGGDPAVAHPAEEDRLRFVIGVHTLGRHRWVLQVFGGR